MPAPYTTAWRTCLSAGVVLLTAFALAGNARASEAAAAALAIEGDPAYGEYLASECVTCHQASGKNDGIPSIVGWPRDSFVVVLYEYKTKKRRHPVMETVTSVLGAEEIAALAVYFEALEK